MPAIPGFVRRAPRRRLVCALIIASVFGQEFAHAAAEFQLERLSASEMHMEPGGSGIYQLRIRNTGDEIGTVELWSDPVSPILDDPNYTLTHIDSPSCGDFSQAWDEFNEAYTVFLAGPVAPGGSVDCAMIVSRGAASWNDRWLYWMIRDDQGNFVAFDDEAALGTLTEVSISARSFDFHVDALGFAHATVLLDVRNGGNVPISPQIAGFCEDNELRPFFTDGSGAGGCGDDSWSPYCFDWGYGFLIPQIDAGATYSCTIRLQSIEPYQHPLAFPIAIDFEQSEAGNGHGLIDTDQTDDLTALQLEPDGATAVAAPAVTRFGRSVLLVLLVFVAAARMRSRSRC